MNIINLPPNSDGMYKGMRNTSHTLATALSDLIDNSLAANAKNVFIRGDWNAGYPCVEILDDGEGMTRDTLIYKAMMFAAKNNARAISDLGKYGLGLKQASFSIGQTLTVITAKDGIISTAQWDGKVLEQNGEWTLHADIEVPETVFTERLKHSSGTVVRITNIDRLGDVGPQASSADFIDSLAETIPQLGETFCRFLQNGFKLKIGKTNVQPIDPTGSDQLSTEYIPSKSLGFGQPRSAYTLKGYVVAPDDDHDLDRQGIYLYRGNRLIGRIKWNQVLKNYRDETARFGRVVIDIAPNDDHAWKISVDKNNFSIPSAAKVALVEFCETVIDRSKRILNAKYGRRNTEVNEETSPIIVATNMPMRPFAISREHKIFDALRKGGTWAKVSKALDAIEREMLMFPMMVPTEDKELLPALVIDQTISEELTAPETSRVIPVPFENRAAVVQLIKLKSGNGVDHATIAREISEFFKLDLIEPDIKALLEY